MPVGVDHQVADHDDRGHRVGAAAGERAQPRQQLTEVKGLGEVIVGTGVEAGDAVLDRVECGEHQDRHAVAARADGAADIHAGHAGQQHVEDDRVPRTLLGEAECGAAGGRLLHVVVRLAQAAGDGGAQRAIIFGEQEAQMVKVGDLRRSGTLQRP